MSFEPTTKDTAQHFYYLIIMLSVLRFGLAFLLLTLYYNHLSAQPAVLAQIQPRWGGHLSAVDNAHQKRPSGIAQDSSALVGQWRCVAKTGQVDDYTRYRLLCDGDIHLLGNGTIESTCAEAFSPSGAHWHTAGNQLQFTDSEGNTMVSYFWQMPDARTLVLEKKGIGYHFERVVRPVAAGN